MSASNCPSEFDFLDISLPVKARCYVYFCQQGLLEPRAADSGIRFYELLRLVWLLTVAADRPPHSHLGAVDLPDAPLVLNRLTSLLEAETPAFLAAMRP